ncbi:MAG TPA: DciA family protein [Phycisphaerales bacterium]|nr:DciA family protein [Phycisphaerales bacterium]
MLGPAQRTEIERLRRHRAPATPDPSLGALVQKQAADLRRLGKGLVQVAGAWDALVPPELAARTELLALARGCLTVRTADAATKYQLERLLAAGGEAALARSVAVPLRRVRVTL